VEHEHIVLPRGSLPAGMRSAPGRCCSAAASSWPRSPSRAA